MNNKSVLLSAILLASLTDISALAQVLGKLRGVVHDSQHRPIDHAQIAIQGRPIKIDSDPSGEFEFENLPNGNYSVTVTAKGFRQLTAPVEVVAGKNPVLHLQLEVASLSETVEVSGSGRQTGGANFHSPDSGDTAGDYADAGRGPDQ